MEKRNVKVYIAGKLNDEATKYIANVHKMIKTAAEVRKAGYSVYVPAVDLLEGIVSGDFEYDDYFDNSQPWLLASDVMMLVEGWESSPGVAREIKLAEANDIPVFNKVIDIDRHYKLLDSLRGD